MLFLTNKIFVEMDVIGIGRRSKAGKQPARADITKAEKCRKTLKSRHCCIYLVTILILLYSIWATFSRINKQTNVTNNIIIHKAVTKLEGTIQSRKKNFM